MKEIKYYIPEIEEFHVSFEYERYAPGTDTIYIKKIFSLTEVGFIQNVYDQNLQEGWFRVKYLDKEDIESFRFIKWIDRDIFDLRGYQLHFDYLLSNDKLGIGVCIFDDGASVIFQGYIKNKSELKKLLIQLDII